jgi:hypothetical protein
VRFNTGSGADLPTAGYGGSRFTMDEISVEFLGGETVKAR